MTLHHSEGLDIENQTVDLVYSSNLDLKLDKIQEYANMRDDVVEKLDAEHTSTANENQPCIICV